MLLNVLENGYLNNLELGMFFLHFCCIIGTILYLCLFGPIPKCKSTEFIYTCFQCLKSDIILFSATSQSKSVGLMTSLPVLFMCQWISIQGTRENFNILEKTGLCCVFSAESINY